MTQANLGLVLARQAGWLGADCAIENVLEIYRDDVRVLAWQKEFIPSPAALIRREKFPGL